MGLFHYSEPSLQLFGLKTGLRNLFHNHLQLGGKKTIGKITQPVNFYTRYPEYHYFYQYINEHLAMNGSADTRILDVGSPKLFGLYLANRLPIRLECTDISPRNIDEYVIMWQSLRERAIGQVDFSIMDARKLDAERDSYDVVYSMSVIEHIEGERADGEALLEMLRVLKPGGLLLFSVPLGNRHQEQLRPLSGSDHVGDAGDRDRFFQRIYSPDSLNDRLLAPITRLTSKRHTATVGRKQGKLLDQYLRLGQNARGLLGLANPLLSLLYNTDSPGATQAIANRYGDRHQPDDIYSDFIYCCLKRVTTS